MFIELVDALRCTGAHQESWLVASAERMQGRDIVTGILGCPVCRREFPVEHGIADFRAVRTARPASAPAPAPDAGQAMRLAAFLNLVDARGFTVLCGAWGVHAPAMQSLTQMHLLLVNPPAGVAVGDGVSAILVDEALPLAAHSARGVALDADPAAALVASAVRVAAGRTRIVAPAAVPVPAGVTELVRDSALWVGEREPDPAATVTITRRAGPGRAQPADSSGGSSSS